MLNFMEELENGEQEKPKGESKALELSDEQKEKLSEAMSVLNALASECDCDVEELIKHESTEEEPAEEVSEENEGASEDIEEGQEDSSEGKNKVALMIAQLKAKKAE